MTLFIKTHLDLTCADKTTMKDPMALAEAMCSKLTCQPAKEVIHDDEDETVTRDLDVMMRCNDVLAMGTLSDLKKYRYIYIFIYLYL